MLNAANLRANPKNFLFAFLKIIVLGYAITAKGIQIAEEKLAQLEDWQAPTKDIERQLGLFT